MVWFGSPEKKRAVRGAPDSAASKCCPCRATCGPRRRCESQSVCLEAKRGVLLGLVVDSGGAVRRGASGEREKERSVRYEMRGPNEPRGRETPGFMVHSGLDRSLVERPRACRDLVLVTAIVVLRSPAVGARRLASSLLGNGVLEMVMAVCCCGRCGVLLRCRHTTPRGSS